MIGCRLRCLVLVLLLVPAVSRAQSGATQQDSTLNNLVHAADYRTAPPGTFGGVIRRGSGPIDVLLIPGWGFGAEVFDAFMEANASRYRMVAVTLPGFGGTAAPAMPPAGTSYAEGTWTRAAEEAVARVIEREGLKRPIVIGHFVLGTQIALRLALNFPNLVGGVVVIGGEPMRYYPSRRDSSGKTPVGREERTRGVDGYTAPRWFKTVTKQTFDVNNYAPAQYSRDTARANSLWSRSSSVPLPVMIRYLCEYMASDLSEEFAQISVPVRVLVPSFSPEIFSDPKQSYVKPLLVDSWDQVKGKNPLLTIRSIPGSRIFITDDKPEAVHDSIAELVAARRRP